MNESRAKVTVSAGGAPPVIRTYEADGGFGYKVDEAPTKLCFRLFYGRKTVIIPLQNLMIVEIE